MFKFVVLFAILAVAAAKPGLVHGGLGYAAIGAPALAYAAPAVHSVHAIPAAVSHQSRVDYISKPVVATYAAPAVVAAPYVTKTIVSSPVVSAYAAAPALAYGAGHLGYGTGHLGYGTGHLGYAGLAHQAW